MRHSIHDTHDEAFATLKITQPEKMRKSNLQWTEGRHRCTEHRNPKPEALEENEAVLSAYGGSIIGQLGTVYITLKYKEKINCIFYVTNTSGPAILGLKADTSTRMCMNKQE